MAENSNNMSLEHWFTACPAGLLILNREGCVHSINPALCDLLQQQPDSVVGRGHDQMHSPELQSLFHPDGQVQLFSLGTAARQIKIESREIPDSQVTRSRRYTNPLCLAVVEIETEIKAEDEGLVQEITLAVSRYLRDRLRWVDLIARWSDDQFMLVLPETTLEDATKLLHKIKIDFVDTLLPEAIAHLNIRLQIGIAEWQKGNDARLLMKRSMEALTAAKGTDATLIS